MLRFTVCAIPLGKTMLIAEICRYVDCHLMTRGYGMDTISARQAVRINCPYCRWQNTPESLFCQSCGRKLR